MAGLALVVGLIFDAVSDPLIGYLSDNTKSRLGRRHPWLYASVLPLSISYFLLWNPPASVQGDMNLFVFLASVNVALRVSWTPFLVPAFALAAEFTSDYFGGTHAPPVQLSLGVGHGIKSLKSLC